MRSFTLLKLTLLMLFMGCAVFQIRPDIKGNLIDFYDLKPPARTRAALRIIEKARDQMNAGGLAQSKSTLNNALSIDPSNPFAYYFLAKMEHMQRRYKRSNGLLEKAKQRSTKLLLLRAKCYLLSSSNWLELGHPKRAKWHKNRAKQIYPNL
jgi:Tfp pilus assembly protein PilF